MTPEHMIERMLRFSDGVMTLANRLPKTFGVKHISQQLVRSCTSIGANYAEAQAAESKADFIHKLQISLKECRESHYWLKLLFVRRAESSTMLPSLLDEANHLKAMLSKAVLTAKSRR